MEDTEIESPAEALVREEYFRGLKEGEKLALDRADIFEKIRKLIERYSICVFLLGTAVVYGGGRTFSFLTAIFGWVKAEVLNDLRHIQAWYLESGHESVDEIKNKLEKIGSWIGLWIEVAFLALVVLMLLVTFGVAVGSGVWIAIVAVIIGGFFWILGVIFKSAGNRLLDLINIGKEDKIKYSGKFYTFYWIAVMIWTAGFYWAIFPSWIAYGFSFILMLGVLALAGLTHVKEWDSNFWEFYKKWIAIPVLVCLLVVFTVKTTVKTVWPETWLAFWGDESSEEISLRSNTDRRLSKWVRGTYKEKPKLHEVKVEPLKEPRPIVVKVIQGESEDAPAPAPVAKTKSRIPARKRPVPVPAPVVKDRMKRKKPKDNKKLEDMLNVLEEMDKKYK